MKDRIISITGLGYVGLQVANSFAKKNITFGYDISRNRISQLKKFIDENKQVSSRDLQNPNLILTNNINNISNANFHIISVPTPVKKNLEPDLSYLLKATKNVAKILKKDNIVVFESTVYPGVTEDLCIPILEKFSKLKCKIHFNVGYSPERINPNDKKYEFEKINKIVSAQNGKTLQIIYSTYKKVIKAKIFKAKSIKVAETAKVIENTQRDLHIALINELSIICDKININTYDVLESASTKWNFLNFKPGLVGGHCIGVDPYYLTYKSKSLGYIPKVILSGRKINDYMAKFIASKIKKLILKSSFKGKIHINILGITFIIDELVYL